MTLSSARRRGRAIALLSLSLLRECTPLSAHPSTRAASSSSYSASVVFPPPPSHSSDYSDLSQDGRHVTIVTTAALPWMTGTSINPLLRAAHLSRRGVEVCLCLPWLQPDDQHNIFRGDQCFAHPDEQEVVVRQWLAGTCSAAATVATAHDGDSLSDSDASVVDDGCATFDISWCTFLAHSSEFLRVELGRRSCS